MPLPPISSPLPSLPSPPLTPSHPLTPPLTPSLPLPQLAEQYGFYAADWSGGDDSKGEGGEALTVVDTEEAWVFHVLSDDTGTGAVWAAQRVADDHVSRLGDAGQLARRLACWACVVLYWCYCLCFSLLSPCFLLPRSLPPPPPPVRQPVPATAASSSSAEQQDKQSTAGQAEHSRAASSSATPGNDESFLVPAPTCPSPLGARPRVGLAAPPRLASNTVPQPQPQPQ